MLGSLLVRAHAVGLGWVWRSGRRSRLAAAVACQAGLAGVACMCSGAAVEGASRRTDPAAAGIVRLGHDRWVVDQSSLVSEGMAA